MLIFLYLLLILNQKQQNKHKPDSCIRMSIRTKMADLMFTKLLQFTMNWR